MSGTADNHRGRPEGPDAKFRETLDFTSPEQRLQLVRDVVAMANGDGGLLVIGAKTDGIDVGVGPERAIQLDPGSVSDVVDGFVSPDSVTLTFTNRSLDDGRVVIEIDVAPAATPPLVLGKAGDYESADGNRRTVFPANSVYVRRGGRVLSARRDDYRGWVAAAERRAREQVLERLHLVIDAPPESQIRVIDADEVREEPSYFLSRAAAMFEQRPERLLDAADLRYLWQQRAAIDLTGSAAELIVQSAFRKRATLFLWLSRLSLHERTLKRYLWRVLEMRDRDKSDAARSILQVCALFLTESDYDELRAALSASDYAHMREAANDWPTLARAREALADSADPGLRAHTEEGLYLEADRLLANSGPGVPRRLQPVGLELLQRTTRRGRPELFEHANHADETTVGAGEQP